MDLLSRGTKPTCRGDVASGGYKRRRGRFSGVSLQARAGLLASAAAVDPSLVGRPDHSYRRALAHVVWIPSNSETLRL